MIEKLEEVEESIRKTVLQNRLPASFQDSLKMWDKINEIIEVLNQSNACLPHNFVPHTFQGSWGGSVPPPNMKCTKCLMESYF